MNPVVVQPLRLLLLLSLINNALGLLIEGTITSINDRTPLSSEQAKQVVVMVLENKIVGGQPQQLTFDDVFYKKQPVAWAIGVNATGGFSASSPNLGAGKWYSVFGFQDTSGNQQYDTAEFEACGWYNGDYEINWMKPLKLDGDMPPIKFGLHSVKPFPQDERNVTHGRLTRVKNYHVLQLSGTPSERGYAHGYLVGEYIMSFFRFFILQQTTPSPRVYKTEVVPFVKSMYKFPQNMTDIVTAMLKGMTDSGTSLHIPELGRSLEAIDILYTNLYGGYHLANGDMYFRRACSQFAFWGASTQYTSERGGTIVGRNMDGENDIRKITVANLLIFAISGKGEARYVHVFWPGMVSSASGFNEHGVHVMLNDGSSEAKGTWEGGYTPDQWMQREILATATNLREAQRVVKKFYDKTKKGACAVGCALMLAQPSHSSPQPASVPWARGPPAMVYEGDRKGGVFRLPGQAEPTWDDMIMVTNHFLIYGYNDAKPLENFGEQVYFSSLWRYASGKYHVDADENNAKQIDVDEMVKLLQTVNHGTTEHSVITFPNTMRLAVSNSDLRANNWYSPYNKYTQFDFEELF